MSEKKLLSEDELEKVAGGLNNKTVIEVQYREIHWKKNQITTDLVTYGQIVNLAGNNINEKLNSWCSAKGYEYVGYKIVG